MFFLHPNAPWFVYHFVENGKNILFYDGHCGLCQGAVKFVLKWEKKNAQTNHALFFAALDSPWLKNLDPGPLPDSILLLNENKLLTKSKAVFALAGRLVFPFSLLSVLRFLPSFLFDWLYDAIARIRHKLAPRKGDLCDVVPPEWKKRLLV